MIFTVTLDRDEDGYWVVECPSIPGCFSQGDTREEALENIKDAIKGLPRSPGRTGDALDGRDEPGRGHRLMPTIPVAERSGGRQGVPESLGWRVRPAEWQSHRPGQGGRERDPVHPRP